MRWSNFACLVNSLLVASTYAARPSSWKAAETLQDDAKARSVFVRQYRDLNKMMIGERDLLNYTRELVEFRRLQRASTFNSSTMHKQSIAAWLAHPSAFLELESSNPCKESIADQLRTKELQQALNALCLELEHYHQFQKYDDRSSQKTFHNTMRNISSWTQAGVDLKNAQRDYASQVKTYEKKMYETFRKAQEELGSHPTWDGDHLSGEPLSTEEIHGEGIAGIDHFSDLSSQHSSESLQGLESHTLEGWPRGGHERHEQDFAGSDVFSQRGSHGTEGRQIEGHPHFDHHQNGLHSTNHFDSFQDAFQ